MKSRVNISSLTVVAWVFSLVLFGMASFTQAATFTVTKTADTNDGTCDADCSLREAIVAANALAGADTITFDVGVFNPGTINVGSALPSLTDASGTIIDGANAANVIIDGGAGAFSGFTFAANSNSNQIKNLTIQNFGQNGVTSVGPNSNLVISGNIIKNNGVDGIFLITATTSTISGNTLNNNTNRGIRLAGSSNTNTISGNTIFSNGGVGIGIFSGSSSNTIQENTIYSNGTINAVKHGIYIDDAGTNNNVVQVNLIRNNLGRGIWLLVGNNTKIYHNTVHSNSSDGITIAGGITGAILRNNIFTNNGGWGINTASAATISNNDYGAGATANTSGTCTTGPNGCPGAGSITADPLYENAALNNFNLKSGSGAINTGCDLGAAGDDTACDSAADGAQPDMNGAGAGNFYGAAPDMGAFESNFASTCPVVSNAADAGPGSLRDCITIANGAPGTTISFSIPAGYCPGGVCTITLLSALPAITAAGTVIDGSTEQPNQGVNNPSGPEIEVAMNGFAGFQINNVGNVTLRELVINGASGAGILITGASATLNKIYGNYIGTNAAGTAAVANGAQGVSLTTSASNNDIGGPLAGEGNVISGNNTHGIQIGANCNNNRIRGNKIGTNATGNAVLGNLSLGIQINGVPASGTVVGGAAPGEGNIVSGNGSGGPWDGIGVSGAGATNVTIYGNKIGTDASGTLNLGNYRNGVALDCTAATCNNKLGGVNSGEENLIAYNAATGVRILSTAGNGAGSEIVGNEIRNNATNGISLQNVSGPKVIKNLVRNNGTTTEDGIRIRLGATSAKIYHNTVHANVGDGISVEEVGAVIKNNIFTSNGGFGINRVAASMEENYNDSPAAPTTNGNTSGSCTDAAPPCDGPGPNGLGANSIITDPLYNADFTLQPGSPAINAGCDLGAAGDDTACDTVNDGAQPDMNGATAGNYNGTAPDMGAYESGGGAATTTIGDGTSPVSKTVLRGNLNQAVDAFTLVTSSGTDTVTALTVTFTGADVNDVAASGVKIYQDNGGTPNEWDATDTLISTASFSGATASFTGLSVSVNTTVTQYLVTYDIASGATASNTLLGAITAATVTNTLVNNDTADATLTVGAPITIVKQVYDLGGACLASIPTHAGCNGGVTSVTVPTGLTVNILIYADNTNGVAATNVRIQDLLDETATGFTFIDNSLRWNNNVTASGATLATIFSDSNTVVLTDTVVGPDDIASAVDTGASPAGKDNITIGTVAGQVNTTLNIPATTTFGFRFQVTKK